MSSLHFASQQPFYFLFYFIFGRIETRVEHGSIPNPASTSEHQNQNESPPKIAQERERERERERESEQEDTDADWTAGSHLGVGRDRGRLGGFLDGHADDAGRGDGGEQDEPATASRADRRSTIPRFPTLPPTPLLVFRLSAGECGCARTEQARRVRRDPSDGDAGGLTAWITRAGGIGRHGRLEHVDRLTVTA